MIETFMFQFHELSVVLGICKDSLSNLKKANRQSIHSWKDKTCIKITGK